MVFQDVCKTCLQDAFLKTSWKRIDDILKKTYERYLEDALEDEKLLCQRLFGKQEIFTGKVFLISMIAILMMSTKSATSRLKITLLFKKRLWLHNFCPWRHQQNLYHMTHIILSIWSCWLKVCKSKLSWRQFYKNLARKKHFLGG